MKKHLVAVPENVLKGMERQVDRLKRLMEMSSILSSTLELDELITLVMEKAKSHLNADASSFCFYNKETNKLECKGVFENETAAGILQKKGSLEVGQGVAGEAARTLQPVFVTDISTDSRFRQETGRFGFPAKSLFAVPLIGRSGLVGVVEMLNPRRGDDDPEITDLLSRQFAIAIENSLFLKETVERERLKQELDIAATIQKSFLPESSTLKKGDLTISAVNISAEEVGGDLYDFFEQDDNTAGVLIGDVSGKGISAALYMARFTSDFRYAALSADSPSLALERLNHSLLKSPRGMFLTCIYLSVDIATGGIQVAVAGHPPFLRITKSGVNVMSVQAGPPLGIAPAEYPLTKLLLEKGDRLLFLTDGVFDAKDKGGRRLGFDNLVRFIERHQREKELINAVIDFVADFSKGAERSDDLTIVQLGWGVN